MQTLLHFYPKNQICIRFHICPVTVNPFTVIELINSRSFKILKYDEEPEETKCDL